MCGDHAQPRMSAAERTLSWILYTVTEWPTFYKGLKYFEASAKTVKQLLIVEGPTFDGHLYNFLKEMQLHAET